MYGIGVGVAPDKPGIDRDFSGIPETSSITPLVLPLEQFKNRQYVERKAQVDAHYLPNGRQEG